MSTIKYKLKTIEIGQGNINDGWNKHKLMENKINFYRLTEYTF